MGQGTRDTDEPSKAVPGIDDQDYFFELNYVFEDSINGMKETEETESSETQIETTLGGMQGRN